MSEKSTSKSTNNKKYSNGALVIVAVLSGITGGIVADRVGSGSLSSTTEARQQIVSSEAEVISEVASTTGESVVSIDTTAQAIAQDFLGILVNTNSPALERG